MPLMNSRRDSMCVLPWKTIDARFAARSRRRPAAVALGANAEEAGLLLRQEGQSPTAFGTGRETRAVPRDVLPSLVEDGSHVENGHLPALVPVGVAQGRAEGHRVASIPGAVHQRIGDPANTSQAHVSLGRR